MHVSVALKNKQSKTYHAWFTMCIKTSKNLLNPLSFLRKKEIDRMLMEMIENQGKSSGEEKEQENGTSEMNGVEKEESDQEDEKSSEVTYVIKRMI